MIGTYNSGRMYKEGVKVALVGPPNAGKSSIFNRLLRTDRAIVTDIPGTTRDVIEESISLDGVIFTLSDTAGLRESSDVVEQEGILRAESQLQTADIVLLILDLSQHRITENSLIYRRLLEKKRKIMVIGNKCDLVSGANIESYSGELGMNLSILVSAKTGGGFDKLKQTMVETALRDAGVEFDKNITVTNLRHLTSLSRAAEDLSRAMETLKSNKSGEFIAPDLRSACNSLGEIVGKISSEDILNNIFSHFCIGK
jgi:tRNA modification GTPase